jgi:hypothetical protein
MKTKMLLIIIVATIGGGATVLVIQKEAAAQKRQRFESQLPQAMSNFVHTFKPDTSPPIFPEANTVSSNRASLHKTNPEKP